MPASGERRPPMRFLRALLAFLALPGVVAGIVPALILGENFHPARTAAAGAAMLALGLVLLLSCVRDFYVSGKGTLAPWDPPARLVVVGLYRFVRNPMYVAVLALVAGWGVAFGSPSIGLYLAVLAMGFHLRVLVGEEPWLRRRFGEEWEGYARWVPRWLPRLRSVNTGGRA
jgi:protein-S-isoprenylcysteine O-methyltransferase Ste14